MKFIRDMFDDLRRGISHYTLSFLFTLILFFGSTIMIFSDSSAEWAKNLIYAGGLGFLVATYLETVSHKENFTRIPDVVQKMTSIAVSVACYFIIDSKSIHSTTGFAGIAVAFFLAGLFAFSTEENKEKLGSHILKSALLAGVITGIIEGGVILSVSAFNYLLVEIPDFSKCIGVISAFAFEVIFLNLALSFMPKPKEEIKVPKTIKVIFYYVAFPVYLLLIVVLYAYLVKILITWILPSGQVNWYASFASLVFIVLSFILPQYSGKIVDVFKRFGGIVLLPIIAIQAYMVWVRFDAYGLTTVRWVSAICTLLAVIFMVISLFKGMRYIRYMVLIAAIAALVLTIGPLNAIDFPAWEQGRRLESVLVADGMLTGGKITPNPAISKADRIKITSCYNALDMYSRTKEASNYPEWLDPKVKFKDAFGFKVTYADSSEQDREAPDRNVSLQHSWNSISLAGYMRYTSVDIGYDKGPDQNALAGKIIVGDKTYDIKKSLLKLNDDSTAAEMIIPLDATKKLYLENFEYSITGTGDFDYLSMRAFVLWK